MLNFHRIPYKPLRHCNVEELGAEQAARDRRELRAVGGVAFARKDATPEKNAARREVLHLCSTMLQPGPIAVLSLPGNDWTFEHALIAQRELNWTTTRKIRRTRLTCVENDRFIYYSAATRLPGARRGMVVSTLPRPHFAEHAIGNRLVPRFVFANVDDVIACPDESFDVAWLDYTGPLTVERLGLIARFYRERVRSTLIVTVLKARWNKDVERAMRPHGGYCEWAVSPFANEVGLHAIEYQDGPSPMFQFACRKVPHA